MNNNCVLCHLGFEPDITTHRVCWVVVVVVVVVVYLYSASRSASNALIVA